MRAHFQSYGLNYFRAYANLSNGAGESIATQMGRWRKCEPTPAGFAQFAKRETASLIREARAWQRDSLAQIAACESTSPAVYRIFSSTQCPLERDCKWGDVEAPRVIADSREDALRKFAGGSIFKSAPTTQTWHPNLVRSVVDRIIAKVYNRLESWMPTYA